jgi:hypothetical protein
MNQRQSVAQYAARHKKSQGKPIDGQYVGRHSLLSGRPMRRQGGHRGGLTGRFLFLLLFLGGAISALTGHRGEAPRDRTEGYGEPDASACETTIRFHPIGK